MKIGEFEEFLCKALAKRKRILAVGYPGVGKTYSFMRACARLGWDFIGVSMPLEDPSTIRGYPSRGTDGRATHCLFDGIARAMDAKVPTLLLGDDAGMASESTLKAWLRFVQFGEIDGRKLPEHVVIAMASNDIGHGAGVQGMISPLKSRFDTIVKVETSVDDVVGYGLAQGWPAWLLAYLRNSPDAVHDFKVQKNLEPDGACPRAWEAVAKWDLDGFSDPEVWSGSVGRGRGNEAFAFYKLQAELPDIAGIYLDPDAAPVPENPSARFLVAMALAGTVTAGNFGSAVKYLNRLPAMFRAFSIRDAFRGEAQKRKDGSLPKDYKPLSASRDFAAWACSTDGKEIMAAAS